MFAHRPRASRCPRRHRGTAGCHPAPTLEALFQARASSSREHVAALVSQKLLPRHSVVVRDRRRQTRPGGAGVFAAPRDSHRTKRDPYGTRARKNYLMRTEPGSASCAIDLEHALCPHAGRRRIERKECSVKNRSRSCSGQYDRRVARGSPPERRCRAGIAETSAVCGFVSRVPSTRCRMHPIATRSSIFDRLADGRLVRAGAVSDWWRWHRRWLGKPRWSGAERQREMAACRERRE